MIPGMRPLRDLPALLLSPMGRLALIGAVVHRMRRPLLRVAGMRRRTLRHAQIVAVTGTYGKTTTVRAISAALGLPVQDGGRRSAAGFLALDLMRHSRSVRMGVFEAGIDRRGEMRPIARALSPNIAVVTSIGSEHHRSLGTLETTRDEKAELVRHLRPGGLAILNGDDPNVAWMATQTRAESMTFGFGPDCDIRARDIEIDFPHGMRFVVEMNGDSHRARLSLLGHHQILAALAALAAAHALRIDLSAALSRLAALPPTLQRLQPLTLDNGAVILRDEFKSGQETIERALDLMAQVPARRRIAILGSITEPRAPQRQTYKLVGERLARSVDVGILLGNNDEDYLAGARGVAGGVDRMRAVGPAWQDALKALPPDLGTGDVVWIKGRMTERLERVVLALEGHAVGCELTECTASMVRCEVCPMLETGWRGRRVVV